MEQVQMTASGKYLEKGNTAVPYSHAESQLLMLTRSVMIFQHPDSSGVQRLHMSRQLACDALVCANSHVALVRVDPVEESLRSHPFHGQTTLQQQKQQQKRRGQRSRSVQIRQKHTEQFDLLQLSLNSS